MRLIKVLSAALLALVVSATASWAVESTNGTRLPLSSSITDFFGRTWTLTNDSTRTVKLNGVATSLTGMQEVWYLNHVVYGFNAQSGWWQFANQFNAPATAVNIPNAPLMPTTPGLLLYTVGPQTGVTCSGVAILAGANIQTAVTANPNGTTFCLAAGTYSGQSVTPKPGNVFIGAFDGTNYTIMNGGAMQAPMLSTLTTSTSGGTLAANTYYYRLTALNGSGETTGSQELSITTTGSTSSNTLTWTAVSGATSYRLYRGTSYSGETLYYAPGNVLTFTDTGAAGTAGTLPTFNSAGGTAQAFVGSADHVVIQNLKITNYNNATQSGIINLTGQYTLILNNIVSLSTTGAGVKVVDYAAIIGNQLNSNGEEGYSGTGHGILFDNNEIGLNNPSAMGWDGGEQGGGKLVDTQHATHWYNYTHDNGGSGFWTDANNIYTLYWYNHSLNDTNGIEHEISYNASMIGNFIEGNGSKTANGAYDVNCNNFYYSCGCIVIENSMGVPAGSQYAGQIEIAYNTCKPGTNGRGIAGRMQNRGTGQSNFSWAAVIYDPGPIIIQNLWVHNNQTDSSGSSTSGQTGLVTDTGDTAIFLFDNNRFDYNGYHVNDQSAFNWTTTGNFAGWQGYGQDIHGWSYP